MRATIISISFLLFSTTSYAVEKAIPIEISADSLVAQEKKGISTYSGNIVIIQGELKIKGDEVTILHPNQKISIAIIKGSPATFNTLLKKDNSKITGHANKITYNANDQTIFFEGNAKITQTGKSSIMGSSILYNSIKQTIQAKGDKSKQERIKVIFTNTSQN